MHHAQLLIELGSVVVVLGVLGRVSGFFGISPIPLYLLGGLAFGSGGLVPLGTSTEFISTGAQIGVVLLLLTLGLEYSASELLGGLRRGAPAGLVDMVLNASTGAVAAWILGWGWLAAVVMAGVTWVSSSGVVAKVLTDLGWLGNRETPAVLSLLVIEDLAMAVYLPVVTVLIAGLGFASGSLHVAIALGALALVLVVALRWGHIVSRAVFARQDEVLLLLVLGIGLLVAGVAEKLNVSAAVGAFLVGIALSGPVAESARSVLEPLRDLFAAVFFVFFGLQTDPGEIPSVLLPAALLALAGAAGKVGTGWYAAKREGSNNRGRIRAGVALIPRGEFSIVIAGLAVDGGVEADLRPTVATYVLILACAGPVAARVADVLSHRTRAAPATGPAV